MKLRTVQSGLRILTAVLCAATALSCSAGIVLNQRKHVSKLSVEALEEQWRAAQLADDAVTMDNLLSEDFVGITATGQVLTKAQQLDRMRSRKVHLQTLDVTDTKVRVKGSIAIVTSQAHIVGTNNGAPLDGIFRYTRIYERAPGGAWKITSFEATRVPATAKEQAGATHTPSE